MQLQMQLPHTHVDTRTHTCRETVIYENVLGEKFHFFWWTETEASKFTRSVKLTAFINVCECVYLTHTRAFKLQQHWQLIHCEERIIMPWLRPTPHSTLEAHLWQAIVPDPFSVITKYTYIRRYMGVTRAPLPRSCSFPFPSYSSSTCRQLV